MAQKSWYKKSENIIQIVATLVPILWVVCFNQVHINIDSAPNIKIFLSFLNIPVLAGFCIYMSIKSYKIEFLRSIKKPDGSESTGKKEYEEILSESMKDTVSKDEIKSPQWYNDRVNILIKQLIKSIVWYALSLIIVYSIYIVDSKDNPLHDLYRIIEDVFNYLSSVFIYFSFLVLYEKTLDPENRRYITHQSYTFLIFISIVYIIFYCILGTHLDLNNKDDIHTAARLSLFAGMFNGFAMMLLFARYISMDFIFRNSTKVKYGTFNSFVIIFLLPVYAVVQPLFGTFDIEVFGPPDIFKNFVFGFCLIGKIIFLLITCLFLRKRILHLYLHLTITQYNLPDRYEKCFKLETSNPETHIQQV